MATSPKPRLQSQSPLARQSRPRSRYNLTLTILTVLALMIISLTIITLLRPIDLRIQHPIAPIGGTEMEHKNHVIYSSVGGYFVQDEGGGEGFDYTKRNLGLIDRPYDTDATYDPEGKKTQWQRFEAWVGWLNRDVIKKNDDTNGHDRRTSQYKVLYLGRHGEGYHNVAEAYYGTAAWDCYWSLQTGNGTISWEDALLTPTGIAQALTAHDFWASHVQVQKIPPPQSYYVSPLSRCLETARLTFAGLGLPQQQPFVPTVKERFRESIGAHTCDLRGSRSYIQERYPTYVIEEGFAEMDPLWRPDVQETAGAEEERLALALDDVFSHDDGTFVSVTTHSGAIAAILRVIGHRKFYLSTGGVIPVLIKAETVEGPAPTRSATPYTTVSTCSVPPTRTP